MAQAAHHYLIFGTAGGFCGIAWNEAGITRFQLPTKSAEATARILLRHVSGAKPGAFTPEVAEAVAAVRRYFEGEETDFSGIKLDLGERDPFFDRVYAAAAHGGTRQPMALWRRSSAPDRKPRATSARPWRRIRWR
jgi:methylated-DNA-[protein]-cysteine S-methyltransferase